MITSNQKDSITITPIDSVKELLLVKLSKTLENVFNVNCSITDEMQMPPHAYNHSKNQYHSTPIIKQLRDREVHHAHKILGVTERNLFVPEANFVFGQSYVNETGPVISLHRRREGFYEKEHNDELFHERITKEAIHELGHAWDAWHCKKKKCIMSFSTTIRDTDKKLFTFCKKCKNIFSKNIKK